MSFADTSSLSGLPGVGFSLRSGGWPDRGAVLCHLEQDTWTNLFSLSWIEAHGLRPRRKGSSFQTLVAEESGRLVGSCLVLAGRTAMPCTEDESVARAFGFRLRRTPGIALEHIVGERTPTGNLWEAYRGGCTPRLDREQLYYVLEPQCFEPDEGISAVRLADLSDMEPLVMASAAMYREETLSDPFGEDPESFRRMHRHRIVQGMSYIWRAPDGTVLFKADVSCASRHGAQIAGVFTQPGYRGRGIARRALSRICEDLLARFPFLTLYVNEGNAAAIHLYQKLGFRLHSHYRTIFVT